MSNSSDSSQAHDTLRDTDSPQISYPHKQPHSQQDHLEFFESLFQVDLSSIEQQEFKAICSIVSNPPGALRETFKSDARLVCFLHSCIARADTAFQDLLRTYSRDNQSLFSSLIPIMLWVFVSQKSKRFVEPFLVECYEDTRSSHLSFSKNILNGFQLPEISHKPICNEEKELVILCYLLRFLKDIDEISDEGIKTFFAFTKNIVRGVENPNINLTLINEPNDLLETTLQYKLSNEITTVVLIIISKVKGKRKEKKKTLNYLLEYTQKELIPHGIFLSKYLLSTLNY